MADSENRPWLRKVLVTLGPLAEWQNKSAGSTVQFASDGTLNGLRVSANIQKTLMGLPSPSTIKVYNREMGSAAVRRLMELVKYGDSYCTKVQVRSSFVERDSVRDLNGASQEA